ncbi:RING-H2 finger protein ATL47-like [Beta vulgaris subsp. vulgaris]|uniref:RING-H2 finger protein ATL47-like n=1 Tax=Beta vulgaris subsp. vulgaris TaxID=3555 RepID=UPI0020375311|nr:RING-H2 finger protein ATL47-like [Beta vulgaris subsp. vulgaris]
MLERTSPYDYSKTQVAVIEWLEELDVEGNVYDCAIDVVAESCEILLDQVLKEDRKSLEMTVEIKMGPEYEHVDDTNMDMDMGIMDHQEEPNETYEEENNKEARMKEVETFLRTMKIIRPSKVDLDCHCSICLEEFDKSEQEVANLGCSHIFHGSCLVSWILEGKNSCPLCRFNFMPC